MAEEVIVATIPDCDLCQLIVGPRSPAAYDGKTTLGHGPWAYMCEEHFRDFGVGLGTGRGQRLLLAETSEA